MLESSPASPLAQTKHQMSAEPTDRFLDLLRAALATGMAHLADRHSDNLPTIAPASCGWRRAQESAPWIQTAIALDDIGESTPVTEQTLKKRLGPKGPASIA
jgi:hypothetical protein